MSDTPERAKYRHAVLRGEQPGPRHRPCFCANCVEKELHPELHEMRRKLRSAKQDLAHFEKQQRAGFGSQYEIEKARFDIVAWEQSIENIEAVLEGRA